MCSAAPCHGPLNEHEGEAPGWKTEGSGAAEDSRRKHTRLRLALRPEFLGVGRKTPLHRVVACASLRVPHTTTQFANVGGTEDSLLLHVANLASIRAFESLTGVAVDPLRFRANLLVDDVAAWAENDWVGRRVQCGGCGPNAG